MQIRSRVAYQEYYRHNLLKVKNIQEAKINSQEKSLEIANDLQNYCFFANFNVIIDLIFLF